MENNKESEETKRNSVREYFQVKEVFTYFFRKNDSSRPTNFNIRAMHGINKISMIIFLLGIIFIILRKII